MGDGVGGADLDGDAVDPLDGVSGPGRLNSARASVVRRGLGGGFGSVRALLQAVERVEAEAERAEDEEGQADRQQNAQEQAEGRGEVEGAGQGVHQG